MLNKRLLLGLMILLCLLYAVLSADIIYVDVNGTGDYTTIQEGINAASDGDTVLVADGIYTGNNNKNLTWDGNEKHLVVKSENGAENCIIDCNGEKGFNFNDSHQDTTDVISGFTITNGNTGIYCNRGIYGEEMSITIEYNIIKENCSGWAYGIIIMNCLAIVKNNTIINNITGIWHLDYYENISIITNNEISNNDYVGIFCDSGICDEENTYLDNAKLRDQILVISNNNIKYNGSYGIKLWHRSPLIKNNDISYNNCAIYAEGEWSSPTVQCNIISYNYGSVGSGISFSEISSSTSPLIGGEPGKGNIFHSNYGCNGADLYVICFIFYQFTATYNTFDFFPVSSHYVSPV